MNEKEWLFEIDNCLPGYWANERYIFEFHPNEPRIGSFTNKEKQPKTGISFKYQTFIRDFNPYLRLFYDGEMMNVVEYRIVKIDCSIKKLELANEGGQSWEFDLLDSFERRI